METVVANIMEILTRAEGDICNRMMTTATVLTTKGIKNGKGDDNNGIENVDGIWNMMVATNYSHHRYLLESPQERQYYPKALKSSIVFKGKFLLPEKVMVTNFIIQLCVYKFYKLT